MGWGIEIGLFLISQTSRAPRLTLNAISSARYGAWSIRKPARSSKSRRMRLDFDERAGFLIDQAPYRADEIAFSVSRGAREVWEIKNSPISMPHPMHLHGFGFRVLRRQATYGEARPLATEPGGRLATDLGVKDTVVLWPNETLWLALDFPLPEDAGFRGAQRLIFHCHNLEHEDGMMMRNFSVV